jgi:hypothetical protein
MTTTTATATPAIKREPRLTRAKVIEVLVVLLLAAVMGYFMQDVARHQVDTQRGNMLLGDQVEEVAGRARLTSNRRLDEAQGATLQVSPKIASFIARAGFLPLTPAGTREMFSVTEKLLPDYLGIERKSESLKSNEPVPGLTWHGDGLYNEWNGTVTVFRNDTLVLVAYSNVPDDLCNRLRFGQRHGVTNFMFACNDDIVVSDGGGTWHADAETLQVTSPKEHLR